MNFSDAERMEGELARIGYEPTESMEQADLIMINTCCVRETAERIAMAAASKQVLCITHLPQIACMADNHLYISKHVADNQTSTEVRSLSEGERINEIARMASGANVSSASLDNAREMIAYAKIKKEGYRKNG